MTQHIGEIAKAYWPLIAGAIALAVAWGTSTAQIAMIGEGQKVIAAKIDRLAEGLAVSQAANGYAKEDIAELRTRVHALEVRR